MKFLERENQELRTRVKELSEKYGETFSEMDD
jgi:hypothetical protein